MKNSVLFLCVIACCLLAACREDPPVYHRADAIAVAQTKLAEYAAQEGLAPEVFKGPYVYPFPKGETSNTSYYVCFMDYKRVFCHHQFTNVAHGHLKSDSDPELATTKWLRSLDPYGDDWFTQETP